MNMPLLISMAVFAVASSVFAGLSAAEIRKLKEQIFYLDTRLETLETFYRIETERKYRP